MQHVMPDAFGSRTVPSSIYERYQRCSQMSFIQHIDIHGKYRSSYNERRRSRNSYNSESSQSSSCSSKARLSPSTSTDDVDLRINRFSITTKVSDLYPGHKFWSKMRSRSKVNIIMSAFEFTPKSRASKGEIAASVSDG